MKGRSMASSGARNCSNAFSLASSPWLAAPEDVRQAVGAALAEPGDPAP